MSDLRERLKQLKPQTREIEIDGMRFLVRGMSRSRRERVLANHRSTAGKLDNYKLEGELLCESVLDPDTHEAVFADTSDWDDVPSSVTGPLFAEVMKVNGMDSDDVGREVKNSDTTGE